MREYRQLTESEIAATLSQKEFPLSVRKAGEKVLVIMTQDWCPQWHDMQSYLPAFVDQVEVFVLVYNTRPDFETILDFKEGIFENKEVPYLRYYKGGELVAQTNWIPKASFPALLKREKRR